MGIRAQLRSRRFAAIALLAAVVAVLPATPSSGDLQSRIGALHSAVQSDSGHIQHYQGRLADLQTRLSQIESSLAVQRQILGVVRRQWRAAHLRLEVLRLQLTVDRRLLAQQLVSAYETPPPNVVNVVLEAHGFTDMLERLHNIKLLAHNNAQIIKRATVDRRAVAVQTARLAAAAARQARVTTAVLAERDQVARLRAAVLERQLAYSRDRKRKSAQLRTLLRREARLDASAAAAQAASFGLALPGGVGYSGGGFAPHDGLYGFFPAPGTNYSVGEEPQIAARLDSLGKALGLHLIGISGYRTPQHSVEVGGFADDPHTRGQASDTPGIEGVPEATLERFGLTRPFGGAAEADHIQLLGG